MKIPLLAVFILLALSSYHGVTQQSDEEKRMRELFLKNRQKMEIVASPTPSAKPTPSAAPSPLRQASPQPNPSARPSTGKADEESSPTPSPDPRPSEPKPNQRLQPRVSHPHQSPKRSGTGSSLANKTMMTRSLSKNPAPKQRKTSSRPPDLEVCTGSTLRHKSARLLTTRELPATDGSTLLCITAGLGRAMPGSLIITTALCAGCQTVWPITSLSATVPLQGTVRSRSATVGSGS